MQNSEKSLNKLNDKRLRKASVLTFCLFSVCLGCFSLLKLLKLSL